jgi:beta-lactamase regulating signal transducer with metallopeptidase domain
MIPTFSFIDVSILEALVMSLVHSFWQGAAIFIMVSAVFSRQKSSEFRYNIASGGLLLLFLLFVFTFLYYVKGESSGVTSVDLSKVEHLSQDASGVNTVDDSFSLGMVSQVFNVHSNTICLIWFCGVVLMLIRLIWGLAEVNKLRRSGVDLDNDKIIEFTDIIRSKLKISRQVVIKVSESILTPMTLGWLKPMLLLPVAVVNGLNIREVEMILAHEMAHIKRNDYLINIIQSFAEVLLFFNPFMWLISARIRAEREYCCDDIALKVCGGDRVVLARALVAVAEISTKPRLAMAMGSLFIFRIKRIINMEKSQSFRPGQFIALVSILCISVGSFLYANGSSFSELDQSILSQNDSSSVLEKEREKLLAEVKILRDEMDSNSVHLPGIVIKGNKSNDNVLLDLENQVSKHLTENTSDEKTRISRAAKIDSLWKVIEKKNARIGEIGSIQMASFKRNFERFWSELNSHVKLEYVRNITLKNGALYIDSLAQTQDKYKDVLSVFEKHFRDESYLQLNLHVKNKEIGLSRYRNDWSFAIPHILEGRREGTSYYSIKSLM